MSQARHTVPAQFESNSCNCHSQVSWLQYEDLPSPTKYYHQRSSSPASQNQKNSQSCSLRTNKNSTMKSMDAKSDSMIQEPVRIFLEKLHPQKKPNQHPITCFITDKNVSNNKPANLLNEVKATSIPASLARNRFQTLNKPHNGSIPEITLGKLEIISPLETTNETRVYQRISDSENKIFAENFDAAKENEWNMLQMKTSNRRRAGSSHNEKSRSPYKGMLANIPANLLSFEWERQNKHHLGGGECGQSLGLAADLKEPQASSQPMKTKGESGGPTVKTPRSQSAFSDPLEHHPALIFSMFPKVPPCLRFSDVNEKTDLLPWEFRKLLHWRPSLVTPVVVKQALTKAHFRASNLTSVTDDLDVVESADWIYYFGKHLRSDVFPTIRDYQKVNHFPCSFHLGRKDRLWRNISAMQKRFGVENFNFAPLTFCMPTDLEKFKAVWDTEGDEHQWILKPPASARGLGVRVVNKWSQIPKKRLLIVQRYLNNPYLINNSKFDLRIYVFIYSVHPLIVYVHEDGLVRFASHIYTNSPRFVGNRYVHLTNYSINRQNVDYISNASDETCTGHKWSLRAFWAYLRSHSVKPEPVWSSIKDVIAKTCIAIEPHLKSAVDTYCKSPYSVQELFGFDVFLDANLKPWLLEVNVSPSMHIDSPLDAKVKGAMIKDMLNLTGFNLPSPRDICNRYTRASSMPPSCGIPQLPPYQHLNINPDSDYARLISEQTVPPTSNDDPPIKNEPMKWMEEIKKPTAPPHPWLLDRRVIMANLSDDERKKHEYYVMRAYEACLSKVGKITRSLRRPESPAPNVIQPEIRLNLEHLPPPTTPDEATIPTSISQGAGPDSLDLVAFVKLQEEHKQVIAKQRLERKQLLHRANMQVSGEHEDRLEATGEQSESPIGEKRWEEGDNLELAAKSESRSTHKPSALEHFRWVVENVLDFITPFDLRCLVQMLDTKMRAGAFQPVFPADSTSTTASYLRFFDKPRYANLLMFAYLDKYGESTEGITMLSELCDKEVHLKSRFFGDKLEESNVWKPPPLIPSTQKSYVENRVKRQITFN